MCCFEASVQLVPIFCQHPSCSLLELDVINVQLVPKYISKVKLDRGQHPNILSEIIIPGENGCRSGNIPISHFLLSLTHSALVLTCFKPASSPLKQIEWSVYYIFVCQIFIQHRTGCHRQSCWFLPLGLIGPHIFWIDGAMCYKIHIFCQIFILHW